MRFEHLAWPFFEETHRSFARDLDAWAAGALLAGGEGGDVDETCRSIVAALGRDGWLRACVGQAFGGLHAQLDARTLALCRETLAYYEPLADFAFAMQGLGSGPLSLDGSTALQTRYLPEVVAGRAIAGFALSERDAGSDVGAIATTAAREGDSWRLDGEKTWISNGGLADFYVVFARTGERPGTRGLSAFVVERGDSGLEIAERIDAIAPHPLGTLRFNACRIPADRLVGVAGDGFKVAMRTLDVFRTSVAAAALGMARRALDEALDYARGRKMFGTTLADMQLTQAAIAQMATDIDASALLTYRAAWTRDVRNLPATREAAMAKWVATETAQATIDRAVQMFGALGVKRGTVVERLYREIRALRIYEGASEVQQMIVARQVLSAAADSPRTEV